MTLSNEIDSACSFGSFQDVIPVEKVRISIKKLKETSKKRTDYPDSFFEIIDEIMGKELT